MGGLTPSALEFEEALSARLRRCRLVFESLDESTVSDTLAVVDWLVEKSPNPAPLLADRYPAVLSAYLVSEAVEKYEGGVFWPNLSLPVNNPVDQALLGNAFIRALRTFGLDTFEAAINHGLTFLTPILAHAGIPRYCVGDFFHKLLIPHLRRGFGSSAGELLAVWRARQTAFIGIDVPVKRFLLYGGSPAADLVDRCIDFLGQMAVGSPGGSPDLGLPRHIAEGLRLDTAEIAQAQIGSRAVPLPQVTIDPWDALGPVLELPPLPRDLAKPSWLVEDGAGSRSLPGSTVQAHSHRLAPARSWTAELRDAKGALRTSVFERLPETGLAAFDPKNGLLARDPHLVPWMCAWLLVPTETSLRFLDATGTELHPPTTELPPLAGLWGGHSLREFNLTGVSTLEAQRTTKSGIRTEMVRILPRDENRARLEGPLVEGVTTEDGLPVYSQFPYVVFPPEAAAVSIWRLHLRHGAKTVDTTAAEAGYPRADLRKWIGDAKVCRVQIRVTGPIGSDLRAEFAVVADLKVERPGGLIFPGEHTSARVAIRAADGVVLQTPGGSPAANLAIGADEDVVRWSAGEGSGGRLLLLAPVARLVWGFARSEAASHRLGTTVERIALDELQAEGNAVGAAALVVSTRCPGLPISLRLSCRGAALSEIVAKTSREGRAAFLLAPFRDAAIASGATSLQMDLLVAGRQVRVATLFARLRLGQLECAFIEATQGQGLCIAFKADVQFSNLEVRVWPAHRPWETKPIRTVALPADAVSGGMLALDGPRCPPGRYLVEVAIHDEWQAAARPGVRAPNTVLCALGDPQSGVGDLRRRAEVDAVAALELLLTDGGRIRELTNEELQAITPLAIRALLDGLRQPGGWDARPMQALLELLAAESRLTASALSAELSSGLIEDSDALGAVISLLPCAVSAAPGWAEARSVWLTMPHLAAQFEVPAAAGGDTEAVSRCREFLDWEAGAPPIRGLTDNGESLAPQQALLGAPPELLGAIKGASELLPGPLLTSDEFAAAGFEWLIRGNAGAQASQWWERHHLILSLAPPSGLAQEHLRRRAAPPGVSPWAGLPQITLAACLALLDGREVRRTRQALMEAVRFAPRLVAFDLALAAVLRTPGLSTRDPDHA